MTIQHGFELVREQEIAELNTKARLFRHAKTGAEVLSMENDDENKVFGITFRTPPDDSTGLPHILEHSVLCGSRKYPLKEPFIEMVKGSLKTFLNAMTYPDKTTYPVASQNEQDFYNLVDVYLDAVFFPRLTPEIFEQEGWHYELESLEDPLIYKGVVFNEMKGVYSSPDNLLYRNMRRALFPGNTYNEDSGGDPRVIPELTYEKFKAFHETYYHPSNARIYFYGDDAPERRLKVLSEYLDTFEAIEVDSAIPLQPQLELDKRLEETFDAGQQEDISKKGMMCVSWLLPESTDATRTMLFRLLSYILISTPASPLRQALLDSGIGEGLTGGGLSAGLRQMMFSAGLKGISVDDVDKVQDLILETLQRVTRDGVEPEMVEAALNTVEFQLRENNTGSYPRGLVVMLASLGTWLHDEDPIAPLVYEPILTSVKEQLANNERVFEELIQEWLLDNKHRVTVVLKPARDIRQQHEEEEKSRLQAVREGMKEEDLTQLIERTSYLKKLQETPDPPEEIAKLPSLKLTDLERENKLIPIEKAELHESSLLYHDLFTNGIVYLDLGFDMHVLPQRLLPYVKLFSRALLEVGTEREDYMKLAQRIRRKTGGIWPSSMTSSVREQDECALWLFLRGKCTVAQLDDMLDILRDVLLHVKLDNKERFRQMVLETKAGFESGLVPSGHGVVNTRLRAQFNEAGWVSEHLGGIEYLFFLRELAKQVDEDWPSVLKNLEEIRHLLLKRNGMLCNVTLDQLNWDTCQPKLARFVADLPSVEVTRERWTPKLEARYEGLVIPAQVNYVAKGTNLYEHGYTYHGSAAILPRYLRTTWLWEKVRVQGGAYGGMCSFNRRSGVFTFFSYRDPNLLSTLENYDLAGNFLRELALDETELARSIIGTIGEIDSYMLPDAKGYTSMVRHIVNEDDALRQELREQILNTTAKQFRAFADALDQVKEHGRIVVLGSQEAIEKANASLDPKLELLQVL